MFPQAWMPGRVPEPSPELVVVSARGVLRPHGALRGHVPMSELLSTSEVLPTSVHPLVKFVFTSVPHFPIALLAFSLFLWDLRVLCMF